jgi:glyoxylase-like metal-dependent hydrolase (beta-lactamase superfamily II)
MLTDSRNLALESNISRRERNFTKFLREKELRYKTRYGPYFLCMQRWNSYTPMIDAGRAHESKGGGYFIKTSKIGIVIDPGFNFIENFINLGYSFNDITHIVISHSHNDHTTDLETLLTLLHQYNKAILGNNDDEPHKDTVFKQLAKESRENFNRDVIKAKAKKKFDVSPRRKTIEEHNM